MWPDWLNNKDSIRRAYEKTIKCLGSDLGVLGASKWMTCTPRMDGDDDDWVEKDSCKQEMIPMPWEVAVNGFLVFGLVSRKSSMLCY